MNEYPVDTRRGRMAARWVVLGVALAGGAGLAPAQQPPAAASAAPAAAPPAAAVHADAAPPTSPAATPTPPAAARRLPAGSALKRRSAQEEAGDPRADTSPTAAAAERSRATPADRVQLDTTTVTGNRELPKVMYVVPWKKSDIGDMEGRPMNSLLDEVLAPVDRDVFRREVTYYQAVKADAPPNGTPAAAAPQPR